MNIAIITSTFPPYRGGMGNVAEHEARILVEAGHEVTVLTPDYQKGSTQQKTRQALQTHGTSGTKTAAAYTAQYLRPWLAIGNAAVLPNIGRSLNGFDAVHLHYPFFGTAEWVALKTLWNKTFTFTLTYHMDVVGSGWKGLIFKLYSRWVFPFIARRATRIIVSSRDYAETSPILQRVWKQVEPKLVEIPFPVLGESVKAQQRTANSEIPQTQGQALGTQKYFICIGGLDRAHYFKGIPNVLRAFAAAKPVLSGYMVKIIGDGDMKGEYQKLAQELGIAESVEFLGSLPPGPEYAKALRGARALISASVDRSEAFGLVLLDALNQHVPLIASNIPGVRTVATPDVAIRIPPNEVTALAVVMGMLANDDALHAKLVAAIPQKLKQYQVAEYSGALQAALI